MITVAALLNESIKNQLREEKKGFHVLILLCDENNQIVLVLFSGWNLDLPNQASMRAPQNGLFGLCYLC